MTKSKKSKQANQKKSKKQTIIKPVYVDRPMPSIGAQIGDKLQKLGESMFTRFFGSGDYAINDSCTDVSKNALIKGSEAKAIKMGSDKGTFVFEHSEYIADVVTSSTPGAFNSTTYTINPQNALTFPWLSNIAPSFESYEIEGMLFRFVSTSGESVSSTNTSIGTVMGTFQYDTLDPNFVSKQQLLQYDDTVDCKFSRNFICGVECDVAKLPVPLKKLYVGPVPSGADAKFYNFGNFVIATQGGQAASVSIGELWVSYRIKFYITKDTNFAMGSSKLSTNTGNVTASPYASIRYNQGSIPAVVSGGSTITWSGLQVGAYYSLNILCQSAAAATWVSQAVTFVGIAGVSLLVTDTVGAVTTGTTGTPTTASYVATLRASANQASITGLPFTCTSTFCADVMFQQLDSSILN